ncbi:hypothetical protein [Hymenobacter rubripertinctus]|uniref:Antitoxin VbhA domain-containing protein n=1 Tax=Hymenobacter rubripertinctus TaxID=2029981 RepID=A0A418R515_9BACT|nr:hypothetical protein [Hymenobacter rubripertinctus]RIY12425.1 hypothetical protein D0T11_05285 [Hymenobacter rubripertinctus]
MFSFLAHWLGQQSSLPATEAGRRRLVNGALHQTRHTPRAPRPYERMLLDQFVRGNLTIAQVLAHLAAQEYE